MEAAAPKCDIFVSPYVLDEAQDGDAVASQARVDEIIKYEMLSFDLRKVLELMSQLMQRQQVLEKEMADAAHIAVCAVSGMDVLLTWNCKHLANIVELPKTSAIITQCAYCCPRIITPKTYMETLND